MKKLRHCHPMYYAAVFHLLRIFQNWRFVTHRRRLRFLAFHAIVAIKFPIKFTTVDLTLLTHYMCIGFGRVIGLVDLVTLTFELCTLEVYATSWCLNYPHLRFIANQPIYVLAIAGKLTYSFIYTE